MTFRSSGLGDIDEGSMHPLLEESRDLHADSMADVSGPLAEMVELKTLAPFGMNGAARTRKRITAGAGR